MAFAATTHWSVVSGGDDATTGMGGGFDTGATFATDLTTDANTGNIAAPIVSSATYNFVAGDVGHWLFVKSGTNWLPGWYVIASVASNKATLTATIGAGVDFTTYRPTTVVGVATVATPTVGSWAIDYSQTTAAGIAYTDIAFGATTTTCTSAGKPFGPNVVGNVIAIASGTNFTVQRVGILSISSVTITVDKSLGTNPGSGGTGNLGGSLGSPGMASGLMVGGNTMWVKAATYSITSVSTNVTVGCPSLPAGASATATTRMIGWNSVRGDGGTKPLLQISGALSTFVLVTVAANGHVENIEVDGALKTSARGISLLAGSRAYRCSGLNCTNAAFLTANAAFVFLSSATGCATAAAFSGANFFFCTAYSNTFTGFSGSQNGTMYNCISAHNSGGASNGFSSGSGISLKFVNCTSYNNGLHGFFNGTAGTAVVQTFTNCLAVSNAGYGFTAVSAVDYVLLINCAGFGNTPSLVNNAVIGLMNQIGLITLTADPFVNAAGNNFALNNTAGGGALLRAAGIPGALAANQFPGLSTLNYADVGAAQHRDPLQPLALFLQPTQVL